MASRFCGECGSPIKPGDRFCSECGCKIIQMSSNEGSYERQMMPMKEFAQNQYNQYPGSYADGPKPNKTKMIVIVSVIVLFTVAVFVGIKFFGGLGSPKDAKLPAVNDSSKGTIAEDNQSILIGYWVTESANDNSIFLKLHDGTKSEFYHKAVMSEYKYKIKLDIIVLNDIYSETVLEIPYRIKSQDIIELYLDNEMSPYEDGTKEWIMFYREGTDPSEYMKDNQEDTDIGSEAEGANQKEIKSEPSSNESETNTTEAASKPEEKQLPDAETIAKKVIGHWEMTGDPETWIPQVWIFEDNGQLRIDDETVVTWRLIDDKTLGIISNDGFEYLYELNVADNFMRLYSDAIPKLYQFIRADNIPIDTEMTNLLKEHWDYQTAYPSESFSDLIAGPKLFSAEIKIDGKVQKMSFGLIRFTGGMDGFAYGFYAYKEGILYISFDPLMKEDTFEKFVIVE